MEISKKQRETINKAITALLPYAEKEVAQGGYFFRYLKSGDELSSEYDCCDKCLNKAMKNLRANIPKYTCIEAIYTQNECDNDRINRCSVCNKPLNEYLTWVGQEFEHHRNYSITKEVLTTPENAFDIKVMLESIPSCDYNHRDDEWHLQKQQELANEVVNYAELIINLLNENMTIAEKFYRKWYKKEDVKLTNDQWKVVNMLHACLKVNNKPKLPFGTMLVNRVQLVEHLNNVKNCLKYTDALMLNPKYKDFSNVQGGKDMARIWNNLNLTFQAIAHFQLNIPLERLDATNDEEIK